MAEEIEDANEVEPADPPVVVVKSPLTLPLILTLAALTIHFGFQTLQFLYERNNFVMVKSSQEAAIQEAQKIQAQFKMLVGKTGELADKGHAGAKMVMEELLKRGVSSAPSPAPPAATKAPNTTETKPTK
ncbi:MAG TPA: hypothetical protein VHR27_01160 [Blastocatellia bacterium]|nr:hypothetical protein [Blastocatellia bacterium]